MPLRRLCSSPLDRPGLIVVVAETGSTNAVLLGRTGPAERLGEGDWLIADRQSAGRGRLGREWLDGPGNFMGSTTVILRPGDPEAASLALLAGVALHEAARDLLAAGSDLRLKWPNDLLLDDAKLAGILLERRAERVVAGFGVNLVTAPDLGETATAALGAGPRAPNRDAFAERLAAAFGDELARWRSAGIAQLVRRWEGLAHRRGTRLQVSPPGEDTLSGTFAGLDEAGNLRLQLENGIRTIHAGDVSLVANGLSG